MANKRRQQLQKLSLNVSELLVEQSLNNLSADKLDVLVQVLPEIDRDWQAQSNNVNENPGDLPKTVIKHREIKHQEIKQEIKHQEIKQEIKHREIKREELGLQSDHTVLPKTRLRRG